MLNRVNKYFFTNFIDNLLSLFLTLFLIVSIVFFINIARITSYVEISFLEFIKLYSFLLPQILLFTLPISFFVSLTMSLFKLSRDNESIVIFTLGKSPRELSIFFGVIAGILSLLMLLNALVLMPYMQDLNAKFIEYKKTRFSLNIRPGEFGQKFGNWYIFASDKNQASLEYENIVLYSPFINGERLIISSGGHVENKDGTLSLVLDKGSFYDIGQKNWQVGEFKNLIISSTTKPELLEDFDLIKYWSNPKKARDLCIYTLIALFPLASVLFALRFGLVVYRYEQRGPYASVFLVLFAYFIGILLFAKLPAIGIPLVFLAAFASSFYLFKRGILRRF